ncbi:AcrR family transcriptional regulator [Kibdelosporangium banguiense]|uniref:AcrR family transcriptional regulator n=1 Tax=Kibdelosporangium banguiense TaxID=1365924 RepID=A0ABS4TLV2_9PSEU|nr:TetR/AcrR family transcriptional regulator [Kibdelosporangium banguiense]MBP2325397.1 AcrR family transcriptional regulator [Kibdelosporangium banguiense]
MPPAPGDHDARRRDVSEAVWRVLAAHGFGHLTLRAVAAEMGVSTGMLTHYFQSKNALVRYAHAVAEDHTNVPARPAKGLASLREALLDVVPLTPEATVMNRVWVSFWDAAIGDPELGAGEKARYERWRTKLRPHVEAAVAAGEIPATVDIDDVTTAAAALTHGIVVQALFDPDRFPPDRLIQLIDNHLRMLSGQS